MEDLAIASLNPVGTSRALILVLGALLGGMLGVFMAFFVKFAARVRMLKILRNSKSLKLKLQWF